jgi:hypothetical protein
VATLVWDLGLALMPSAALPFALALIGLSLVAFIWTKAFPTARHRLGSRVAIGLCVICSLVVAAIYIAVLWHGPDVPSRYVGIYESRYWNWDNHKDDGRGVPLTSKTTLRRRFEEGKLYDFVFVVGCWIPNGTIAADSDVRISFFGTDLTVQKPDERWWQPLDSPESMKVFRGFINEKIVCGDPSPGFKSAKGPDAQMLVTFPRSGLYVVSAGFEGHTLTNEALRVNTSFSVELYQ